MALDAETGHSGPAGRGRGMGRGRGGAQRGGKGARPALAGPADNTPGSIPTGSVSKLKSQLRQTKRLLARDDITPDVRTTTERRLKLLEQELEKAQHSQLERKMVLRYKGVRFFERQKLLRKIKQAKRAVTASPNDEKLKQTLFELRVDLAYVLRYPKLEKYIAIFPEGHYVPHEPLVAPETPSSATTDNAHKSAVRRWTLRQAIRGKMKDQQTGDKVEEGDLDIEGEESHEKGASDGEEEGEVGTAVAATKSKKRARADDTSAQSRPTKKDKAAPPPAPNPPSADAANVTDNVDRENPVEPLTRKQKKDLKDARRRANKLAKMSEAVVTPTDKATSKPDGWAADDDFFA